jgi:hypothetical protein
MLAVTDYLMSVHVVGASARPSRIVLRQLIGTQTGLRANLIHTLGNSTRLITFRYNRVPANRPSLTHLRHI